jgi:hypothetical protein
MPCQMQEMHNRKLYICYKGAPTHQLKKSNKHQAPQANEWNLLDLGIWWKYQLVGHVRVHGSRLSSLSLHCLSENDTSLLCAWFWNGALGSLQLLWHWCCHIEVGLSILLTKITHGVGDPKDLKATTSCGNVLCLGSGLSNTRPFPGRPRHQKRYQNWQVPEVDFYPTDAQQNPRLKNH